MRVGRAVKIVLGAGLVVTGLALGGATGVTTRPATAATIRDAAAAAEHAPSAGFKTTIAVTAQGESATLTGSGVVDAARHGEITLHVRDTTPEATHEATLEERVLPNGYYLDYGGDPSLADRLPGGKRWAYVSFDDLAQLNGTDFQALQSQADQAKPNHALENLQATSGPVERVGDDTVNGMHATRYRVSIDYAKYAAEHMAAATPEQRAAVAGLGAVPADVWIDDADRAVKLFVAYDLKTASSGTFDFTTHVDVEFEITGFDVPVHVQAPPADQVYDLGAAEVRKRTV